MSGFESLLLCFKPASIIFFVQLVQELEQAIYVQKEGKQRGLQMIFAKFDTKRSMWAAAAQCTSILDALGSLAQASSKPGFIRPTILECPSDAKPSIHVSQGRHPCVDNTHNGGQFIPNDLTLGASEENDRDCQRVLLLSGPNMVCHRNLYSSAHRQSSCTNRSLCLRVEKVLSFVKHV